MIEKRGALELSMFCFYDKNVVGSPKINYNNNSYHFHTGKI